MARPGRPLGETARNIRAAVAALQGRYDRMTVRQVFYALSVQGVVEKTETGYRQVGDQLVAMRRQGLLSWGFIADGTRWRRKPSTWESVSDYAESVARLYRRDLWRRQDVRLEVWLEKDALAGVIVDVTHEWDVALMVSKGQPSVTFLHSAAHAAAEAWMEASVHTHIYTLYDYDAGGARAARAVAKEVPAFARGLLSEFSWPATQTPVTVERIAVTPEQIVAWDLPTRPPKKKDPEARAWGDKPCVELDAIPPERLTELVEDAIVGHIDERSWLLEKAIEEEEQKNLNAMTDLLRDAA